MKSKTFWSSVIALISILALFFLAISIWAFVYTFVYGHTIWVFVGALGILSILLVTGLVSWKKIKRKLVDIVT